MYDKIYEIWKKEKENENKIQQLPKEFYIKIASYIKKLKEENRMLDKKSTKSKLLNIELENVNIMASEIFSLRHKKLREKISFQKLVVINTLTEEEKKLYNGVFPLTKAYKIFIRDVLGGYVTQFENDSGKALMVLRFVHDIPALIGADLKTYGPFRSEDVATLPPENARILIRQGAAVEVNSK